MVSDKVHEFLKSELVRLMHKGDVSSLLWLFEAFGQLSVLTDLIDGFSEKAPPIEKFRIPIPRVEFEKMVKSYSCSNEVGNYFAALSSIEFGNMSAAN
jgi:hypothetical protein